MSSRETAERNVRLFVRKRRSYFELHNREVQGKADLKRARDYRLWFFRKS